MWGSVDGGEGVMSRKDREIAELADSLTVCTKMLASMVLLYGAGPEGHERVAVVPHSTADQCCGVQITFTGMEWVLTAHHHEEAL